MMKKLVFRKETIKSKKFLITFVLVTICIAVGTMMAQNKYASAIDSQKIQESLKNQGRSDGGYYSAYELNEKEFRAMIENSHFREATIKKEDPGHKIICQNGGKKYVFTVITENKLAEIYTFLQDNNVKINFEKPRSMRGLMGWGSIVLIIFIFVLSYNMINNIIRGRRGGAANSQFNEAGKFSKAPIEILQPGDVKTTFNDVAGCDEAKIELQELIDFLKNPFKYTKLGAKIPKGVLLLGPPGCGKTLLAKAIAGEAEVPFIVISGSAFTEMFVGVGASRVRDAFKQPREIIQKQMLNKDKARGVIMFIDEIDGLGKKRGGLNSHDEREQTLNQFLAEMDGFGKNQGLIIIGATNRPDMLDPAFERPGRFNRKIIIDYPNLKGREEILKIHAKNVVLKDKNDLNIIAKRTPGLSGADLAEIINEAALLAARFNKNEVELQQLDAAIMRVLAGPEQKSKKMTDEEKERVSYHEAGHAVTQSIFQKGNIIHKISIIRTGKGALGYTLSLPTEDKYLSTSEEIENMIKGLLGGRAAEELFVKTISTGATNDLEKATQLCKDYICKYGMSKEIGLRCCGNSQENFIGYGWQEEKDYSEHTAQLIDQTIKTLLENSYEIVKEAIKDNENKVEKIVQKLLEKEVLEKGEIEQILSQ